MGGVEGYHLRVLCGGGCFGVSPAVSLSLFVLGVQYQDQLLPSKLLDFCRHRIQRLEGTGDTRHSLCACVTVCLPEGRGERNPGRTGKHRLQPMLGEGQACAAGTSYTWN